MAEVELLRAMLIESNNNMRKLLSETTDKLLLHISEKDLLITTAAKLNTEISELRRRLNAINNLATSWQEIEVGPEATWIVMDSIYKLSAGPQEKEGI